MNLCIDIGNTRAKLAVFNGKDIVHYGVEEEALLSVVQLTKEYKIDQAIICSTRTRNEKLIYFLKDQMKTIILDHQTRVPIKNNYDTPGTLGKDRLAAAVAAYTRKPNQNHLIIDAGTCMTLDLVDESGTYQGGNISPGILLRIKAMHHFTRKLPLVDKVIHESLVGKNTVMAIQNGAALGTLMEVESFIERIENQYTAVNITLTGGDAQFLAEKLKKTIFVAPNLVLEGLNEILLYNAS